MAKLAIRFDSVHQSAFNDLITDLIRDRELKPSAISENRGIIKLTAETDEENAQALLALAEENSRLRVERLDKFEEEFDFRKGDIESFRNKGKI